MRKFIVRLTKTEQTEIEVNEQDILENGDTWDDFTEADFVEIAWDMASFEGWYLIDDDYEVLEYDE